MPSCKKSYLTRKKPYSSYSPATLNGLAGVRGFYQRAVQSHEHLPHLLGPAGLARCPGRWGPMLRSPPNPQGIEVPYYNYTTLISTDGAASYTWFLGIQDDQ